MLLDAEQRRQMRNIVRIVVTDTFLEHNVIAFVFVIESFPVTTDKQQRYYCHGPQKDATSTHQQQTQSGCNKLQETMLQLQLPYCRIKILKNITNTSRFFNL